MVAADGKRPELKQVVHYKEDIQPKLGMHVLLDAWPHVMVTDLLSFPDGT